MSHVVDPLSTLRPLREDEIQQRTSPEASPQVGPLAYDVYRSGSDLVIEFDAPGVAPSDIAVRISGRAVEVSVRRTLSRGPGVDVIEAGRQHGTFHQRLWLGDRWDLEGMQAVAEHGVLTVRAPLVAEPAHRTVVVTTGTTSAPTLIPGTSADMSVSADTHPWSQGDKMVDPDVADGSGAAAHGDATGATHSAA